MSEQWRPVVGYEYEISSLGRVFSLPRRARTVSPTGTESTRRVDGTFIRPQPRPDGRLVVELYKDGARYKRELHSLVLEAFVGPRPLNHHVEHLNNDPADCRLSNLRWAKRTWFDPRLKPNQHNNEQVAA